MSIRPDVFTEEMPNGDILIRSNPDEAPWMRRAADVGSATMTSRREQSMTKSNRGLLAALLAGLISAPVIGGMSLAGDSKQLYTMTKNLYSMTLGEEAESNADPVGAQMRRNRKQYSDPNSLWAPQEPETP